MRRLVRNFLGFALGFLAVAVPVLAFADCVGPYCDLDWESCDWQSYSGATTVESAGGAWGVGDWAATPYIVRQTLSATAASGLNYSVRSDFAGQPMAMSYIVGPAFSSYTFEYADIQTCSFFGGETVEMVPLVPDDPQLLADAFAWSFGFVVLIGLTSQGIGWVLNFIR